MEIVESVPSRRLNAIFLEAFHGRCLGRAIALHRSTVPPAWSRRSEALFFLSRGESSIASVRVFDCTPTSCFCTHAALLRWERVGPPCHCRFRTADNHLLLMIEALCCPMRRESTLFYDCKNLRSHFAKVKRNGAILTPFW